jgi:hypothetical protein
MSSSGLVSRLIGTRLGMLMISTRVLVIYSPRRLIVNLLMPKRMLIIALFCLLKLVSSIKSSSSHSPSTI